MAKSAPPCYSTDSAPSGLAAHNASEGAPETPGGTTSGPRALALDDRAPRPAERPRPAAPGAALAHKLPGACTARPPRPGAPPSAPCAALGGTPSPAAAGASQAAWFAAARGRLSGAGAGALCRAPESSPPTVQPPAVPAPTRRAGSAMLWPGARGLGAGRLLGARFWSAGAERRAPGAPARRVRLGSGACNPPARPGCKASYCKGVNYQP